MLAPFNKGNGFFEHDKETVIIRKKIIDIVIVKLKGFL